MPTGPSGPRAAFRQRDPDRLLIWQSGPASNRAEVLPERADCDSIQPDPFLSDATFGADLA
ncbi:MAG: hypothetical protein CL908_27040 [Deltaproteobacteria bacterium]|nr:hypothetical protein [Deltaproteobacteria bacterium]